MRNSGDAPGAGNLYQTQDIQSNRRPEHHHPPTFLPAFLFSLASLASFPPGEAIGRAMPAPTLYPGDFHRHYTSTSFIRLPAVNVGATIGRPEALDAGGSYWAGNARPYIYL